MNLLITLRRRHRLRVQNRHRRHPSRFRPPVLHLLLTFLSTHSGIFVVKNLLINQLGSSEEKCHNAQNVLATRGPATNILEMDAPLD